jgi:small subunit ribosomal protein S16
MAVTLRLARHGSKNRPFYHLVATDHRMRRDGRFIEKLGLYDPANEPSFVEFKEDRIRHWYGLGAEVSPTVAKLLKAKNIKLEREKTTAPGKTPKKKAK